MKKSIVLLLVAASLLNACKRETQPDASLQITKNDVIRLEGSFDHNFLESWEYVLLDDDNPKGMVSGIDGILYDDSLFFILSGRFMGESQIKVFDHQGRYLNDIGHAGRARNEYIHIYDWAIDTRNNRIIVLDNNAYVLKRFDYKGEFIDMTPLASYGPTEGYLADDFVKYVGGGSILTQSYLSILPSYDYYMRDSDGTNHSPFTLTDYRAHCDMDPLKYVELTGDVGGMGLTACHSNICSDTTYLLRPLDNHIYKLYDDSVQCLANMAFIPEIPYRVKCDYDDEADHKYRGRSFPNYFFDMKDYLYMWYYYDNEYVFEKSTSKMYQITHDTLHVSVPETAAITICDNTIIGNAEDYFVREALKIMDRPDYDHRYTPEVEAFYRKMGKSDCPAIIIAHYK